jgi:hypothetical protein
MQKYILFFFLSLTLFVGHAIYTRHAIYGDGNGYYVTAQSLLYDQTFKSDRILTHLKNFSGRDYVFSRVFWDENKNPYSVGTSLFWIPSLALISLFSANPLDLYHELGPGFTGILFMLGGLYFIEKYLAHLYSPRSTFFTILTLFVGSNLFYYTTLEPALSHQPAFFLIAFLLYWTRDLPDKMLSYLLLGVIFGVVQITRIADTFLLVPIFFALKLDLKKIIMIGLGFMVGMAPQISAQYFYYGTIAKNFYLTESSNQWSFQSIHLFEYLFSYQKGLFVWSPVYLMGLVGLLKIKKYLILLTIIFIWCLGAFWSEHSSMTAGFGQRLSLAAVPYFALGIGYFYNLLDSKKMVIMTVICALWNLYLLYGFYALSWKNL